jgi:hypothetical protein
MACRIVVTVGSAVLVFAFASCSDRRPEEADVKAEFRRLYPAAEIVSARMSEDEVVARSFDIAYRRRGETQTKKLNLQYMKNDKGVYELRPTPPPELP